MSYFNENDIEVLQANLYWIVFNQGLGATTQGANSPSDPLRFAVLPRWDPLKVISVPPVGSLASDVLCWEIYEVYASLGPMGPSSPAEFTNILHSQDLWAFYVLYIEVFKSFTWLHSYYVAVDS